MEATNGLGNRFTALQLDNSTDKKNYFHCDWVDTSKLTFAEAILVAQEIQLDSGDNSEETFRRLKNYGVEVISDTVSCAFLNAFVRDFEQAQKDFKFSKELLDKAKVAKFLDKNQVDGIEFVLKCVDKFISGSESVEEIDENAELEQEFKRMSGKASAVIIMMKVYFIYRLPPKYWIDALPKTTEEVEGMIQMDPESAEGHICHYRLIWCLYRNDKCGVTNATEKVRLLEKLREAVEAAMACEPNHPRVLLHFCECLVQLSKGAIKNGTWQGDITCAGRTFSNFAELTEAIMEANRTIINESPSAYNYVKIAIGLFVRLHWQARTPTLLEFAKKCLEDAVRLYPNSSNVFHKLGLYSLTIDKDLETAIAHFEKSLDYYQYNFSALVDLVQTLMANPATAQNGVRILKIINENLLATTSWSTSQKGELVELKAYTLMMQGMSSDAIKCWIQANEEFNSPYKFGKLHFLLSRYKWPRKFISLELIMDKVELERDPANTSLNEFAAHLDEVLRLSIANTDRRWSQNTGRGGGSAQRGAGNRQHNGERRDSWRSQNGFPRERKSSGASTVSAADSDSNWRN